MKMNNALTSSAVTKEDESSLHIVDFLAQNCQGEDIDKQDIDGKTGSSCLPIPSNPAIYIIYCPDHDKPYLQFSVNDTFPAPDSLQL